MPERTYRPEGASTPGLGVMAILLAWGILVLSIAAGGLADVTNFWWLVLVFGVVAPVAVLAWHNRTLRTPEGLSLSLAQRKERELLGVLEDVGPLSPTAAAMRTTLTVEEAAQMLETLARKGHLEVRAGDGTLEYALREQDRRALRPRSPSGPPEGNANDPETQVTEPRNDGPSGRTPGEMLDEPLSEREIEVLQLLASGRTNAEIAGDLYVALGTVKAHVNNIYRKLGVRNRAEAVSHARSLGLLRRG